jgi:hypothetical protein
MQNFREAVKQALKGAPVDVRTETPWDKVLREFAASINEEKRNVLAFVRRGSAPSVRHLILTPKGHRDQTEVLLSVEARPKFAVVYSWERREFTEVEDFQAFLVSLAGVPEFRNTLETLGNMASAPVIGFLRSGPATDRSPARDIVVKVPAEDQQMLADAAEARQPVTIYVDPEGPSPLGQGVYDPKVQPRWLVSGGYVLEIEDHNEEFGRIKLRGTPLDPDQLEE